MSKTNDDKPRLRAFPERSSEGFDLNGMDLRDWLAGQALAGIVGNPTWNHGSMRELGIKHGEAARFAAAEAYAYADAMLAARQK